MVLDVSVLTSMFGDDDELKGVILEEFKRSALPYMEELAQALAANNISGVRALAHKLKSSSRTVGALALGDACEQLEQITTSGQWATVEVLAAELRQRLAQVLEAIDGQ